MNQEYQFVHLIYVLPLFFYKACLFYGSNFFFFWIFTLKLWYSRNECTNRFNSNKNCCLDYYWSRKSSTVWVSNCLLFYYYALTQNTSVYCFDMWSSDFLPYKLWQEVMTWQAQFQPKLVYWLHLDNIKSYSNYAYSDCSLWFLPFKLH